MVPAYSTQMIASSGGDRHCRLHRVKDMGLLLPHSVFSTGTVPSIQTGRENRAIKKLWCFRKGNRKTSSLRGDIIFPHTVCGQNNQSPRLFPRGLKENENNRKIIPPTLAKRFFGVYTVVIWYYCRFRLLPEWFRRRKTYNTVFTLIYCLISL